MQSFLDLLNPGHQFNFNEQTQDSSESEKIKKGLEFVIEEIKQKIMRIVLILSVLEDDPQDQKALSKIENTCNISTTLIRKINSVISELESNPIVVNDPNTQTKISEVKNQLDILQSHISQTQEFLS